MVNNSPVRYHRKKKKSLWKYQNLSKEEKENKQQFDCKRYKNIPEYKKSSLSNFQAMQPFYWY